MIKFLDEKPPVSLWVGASLAHLGKNPYGENLWRVVWSESVYRLFKAADWTTFKWIPSYHGMKCYVLEKWISAWEHSKCGPETWAAMGHAAELGPYPDRGLYFGPKWEFHDGVPTLGAVNQAVMLHVAGDQYSEYEKTLAVIQAAERDDEIDLAQKRDIILEALPTNITNGKFMPSALKRAANIPEKYSAQDILKMKGLPFGEGKAFTSGAKRI
jgi:hypothetical protein